MYFTIVLQKINMWFVLETKDIKEHIKMAFDGITFRDQKKKKEKNKYPYQLNQITGNRDQEQIFLDRNIINKSIHHKKRVHRPAYFYCF